jgi:hypothetical protein
MLADQLKPLFKSSPPIEPIDTTNAYPIVFSEPKAVAQIAAVQSTEVAAPRYLHQAGYSTEMAAPQW